MDNAKEQEENKLDGVDKVKQMVKDFELSDELSELTFLQVRISVGGITDNEMIAYRGIYDKIVDSANAKITNEGMRVNFHVAENSKEKKFKNKDMMILMEAITAKNYKDVFGGNRSRAILEQDERFLNEILRKNLGPDFGAKVVIALSGDIDKDVESLSELSYLLLKRGVKEIASSQVSLLKVSQCNPWDLISKNSGQNQENHLVVGYIDHSQESLLDIDLLQQILYVNGMLKKIKNKKNQKLAVMKIAENKRKLDAARVGMPLEEEVYNIQPENILGDSDERAPKAKLAKDVIGQDVSIDNPKQDVSIDTDESNQKVFNKKLKDKYGFVVNAIGTIKEVLTPNSKDKKKKTDEQIRKEIVMNRVNSLDNKYLTEGINSNKKQPFIDLLHPNYDKESVNSMKSIDSIESILERSLSNSDKISHKELNYAFTDVTGGISVKFTWKANNCDIQ